MNKTMNSLKKKETKPEEDRTPARPNPIIQSEVKQTQTESEHKHLLVLISVSLQKKKKSFFSMLFTLLLPHFLPW